MIACVVLRIGNIWSRAAGGIVSLRIGYARVSTKRQNLAVQINGLREADCDIIFTDTASGGEDVRRGLQRALRKCRSGDRLVVWRLDRLSRKLVHMVGTVEHLTGRGVHLQVLNGRGTNADFSEPEGRFVLGVLPALPNWNLKHVPHGHGRHWVSEQWRVRREMILQYPVGSCSNILIRYQTGFDVFGRDKAFQAVKINNGIHANKHLGVTINREYVTNKKL